MKLSHLSSFLLATLILTTTHRATKAEAPSSLDKEKIKWELRLGTHQYTIPLVDNGQIFLGVNDRGLKHPNIKPSNGGLLLCLDEDTGDTIWQLPIPRNMEGTTPPFHFNHWKCGICSQPQIDGDRMYLICPRGGVICVDRKGQANGNDGPFLDDAAYMGMKEGSKLAPTDGDVIWRYDMIKELKIYPHDVCGSTVLIHGDYVYALTSNGKDDKHKDIANPNAPSLIVLEKKTGKLVAIDGKDISTNTFHGQWSTPALATVNGKSLILFGAGDGYLYAYEPITPAADGKVATLKIVWRYDCNPPEYRAQEYARHTNKSKKGPSEIIARPIVYNDRVYVPIGQSPVHGPGQGNLSCIDLATGKKVWDSQLVDRSTADVAIHNGLLYASDFSGKLNCFDADTGEHFWTQDLEGGTWHAFPTVLDDKVYISTEKMVFWIMETGKEKKVIARERVNSPAITPIISNGVFFLPLQNRMVAYDCAE